MSDLDEPADAGILAQKLVEVMELPFQIDSSAVSTSISIGIALYEPDTDAEALLSRADVALYRSKSEGGHTYRFFDDAMDVEIHSRVSLVAELREALAARINFFSFISRRWIWSTGRIIGVEALVRWRHPARGVLLPGAFIPAAERAGLIAPLGKWVLEEACRQARRWLDEGIAPDLLGRQFFLSPVENAWSAGERDRCRS